MALPCTIDSITTARVRLSFSGGYTWEMADKITEKVRKRIHHGSKAPMVSTHQRGVCLFFSKVWIRSSYCLPASDNQPRPFFPWGYGSCLAFRIYHVMQ